MRPAGSDEAPRFLIVRRDNIGDLVCTTPMFSALRERFPNAMICALVNSYNAPVLHHNPHIDRVFVYTKAKHRAAGESLLSLYSQRLRMLWNLRRARFDYVILPGNGPVPRAQRLARWIGAQHVVGFVNSRRNRGVDMAIPYDGGKALQEAEDVFRLLAPLGIKGEPSRACVVPNAERVERLRGLLREHGIAETPVAVHVSARKPSNRWPAERFSRLIREVHARHGWPVVLLWSPGDPANPRHPGDDAKAQAIMASLNDLPVLAYPTHVLDDLIAALACCRLFVGGDGGAMHLAAGLGLPVVAFFGRSGVTRWRPWGVPYVALQPPSLEVTDVSVEEALHACDQLIYGSRG